MIVVIVWLLWKTDLETVGARELPDRDLCGAGKAGGDSEPPCRHRLEYQPRGELKGKTVRAVTPFSELSYVHSCF